MLAAKGNVVIGMGFIIGSYFSSFNMLSGLGALFVGLGGFHHLHFHWLSPLAQEVLVIRGRDGQDQM